MLAGRQLLDYPRRTDENQFRILLSNFKVVAD